MQDEFEVVCDVSKKLDGAGIGYMLTGSMALNFYTNPRMTRDIDVVVEVDREDVSRLMNLFGADYYISQEAVQESVVRASMFNIVHNESLIKVDCIVRKPGRFRVNEFDRRQRVTIEGFDTWIVSKEDLILSKLYWAKDSHSEMQLRDVKNLVSTGCDSGYIESWTAELGVDSLWKEITWHE